MNNDEKVKMLESNIERLLQWNLMAESRLPFLFAIDAALMGYLVTNMPKHINSWSGWQVFFIPVTCLCLVGSVILLLSATFPRTKGPESSLIFFCAIANRSLEQYKQEITNLQLSSYLNDLIEQNHINANILKKKYDFITYSIIALFVGFICWLGSIYVIN
jgi:Family of unknown function (DUF5706)